MDSELFVSILFVCCLLCVHASIVFLGGETNFLPVCRGGTGEQRFKEGLFPVCLVC